MKVLLCFETHLLAEGIVKLLQQLSGSLQFEIMRTASVTHEQLLNAHFDLLLLDIDAYGADVNSLLLGIKKTDSPKKVIFVFDKYQQDVLKAYRNGLDGSFSKQDSSDGVLAALSVVLNGKVHVPQSIILHILCDGFVFTEVDARLNQLTKREITVLEKIAENSSMKDAARLLNLAPSTLSAHKQRIMKKLSLSNGQEFNNFVRAFEQQQKSPTRLGETSA
ncbi:MAG: LuxR C-terminal-related transcriptional regulator [Sphingomonadales bacterium]